LFPLLLVGPAIDIEAKLGEKDRRN